MVEQKFKKTQDKTLKKMKESYQEKSLIPFIGAGFSSNIPGYPLWEDFIDVLSGEINVPIHNIYEDPNEATEFYIWCKGRDKSGLKTRREIYNEGKEHFRDRIITELNKQELVEYKNGEDWKQHSILVEKFDRIYTTNWDKSLEITAKNIRGNGTKFFSADRDIIVEALTGNESKHLSNTKIEIIKLHGDCFCEGKNRSEGLLSLMAGQTDFFERMSKTYAIDNFFIHDSIAGTNFLFIGYSLSDPNIKYTLYQVRTLLAFVEAINPSVKNELYWLTLEDPAKYHEDYKDFLKEWMKMHQFYLFSERNMYNEYRKLLDENKKMKENLREKREKSDENGIKKVKKEMEKNRKNQQDIVKPILIKKLEEIVG